ncbi:ABC transporter ATP-binding protein [Paraburkholderia solisilvae]|uniref:Taurine import ATP-binding protein TauB n=1 Tax=Paraburkholderia solisilvae TaxID=624376 RepID=A0A6J5DTQ5_9BURK|nr:ABC transporter ATP-binding protein [Paraburkholderia solisilvae]CAB3756422.1 Taurine import ATP-binding protein TauB [Paraburkholderia solisilvae]
MSALPMRAMAATLASEPVRVAVELAHVSKRYGKLDVLDDISLAAPVGSVLAIVGASGCGKSTLLNIIAGLVKADSGKMRIDGVAGKRSEDTRVIGYMFQEDRLLPWRTIAANAEFGLEAGSLNANVRRERALEMLHMTGLQGFENAYPHELSGGMRSRVALARSLVVKPYILLMDEPFSKLDPQMRSQMHAELLRVREQLKMTVVFVTHDVEEAIVLADRVVVLRPRPGRVRDVLDIELARPRNPLAAEVAETVRHVRALI